MSFLRTVIKKAGTVIGTRRRINFIEGTNVTLTIADDSANDEVDITITAAGGSCSPGGIDTYVQFNDGGSFGGDLGFSYNKTTDKLSVGGSVDSPEIDTNTLKAKTSAGVVVHNASGADCLLLGAGGSQNATFYDGVKLDASTASRILSTDASKNITALDTTTYPSLTELAYLKGVTSSIQTQINALGGVSQSNVRRIIRR